MEIQIFLVLPHWKVKLAPFWKAFLIETEPVLLCQLYNETDPHKTEGVGALNFVF